MDLEKRGSLHDPVAWEPFTGVIGYAALVGHGAVAVLDLPCEGRGSGLAAGPVRSRETNHLSAPIGLLPAGVARSLRDRDGDERLHLLLARSVQLRLVGTVVNLRVGDHWVALYKTAG